ncbi:tripartite ATP-independent transporter solute receptor, DctP family [Melghirimyces thermohalophilus]|uniref:Tripartite ATP-independent transporter solute receptor, DctP family n=2 Tax=Melghirimyces thermohalophilus TaxID=1236220 RepID=A0A1G6NUS1_9BACL|nr:tripartite ATP-independent transporter solute receptor, DctP family [Melghirimyces thermohalophilus]
MKKMGITLLASILMIGLLSGCSMFQAGSDRGGKVKLIAATQLDSKSAFAEGFREFKKVVEKESDGTVTVEVHTNGDLGGNEDELVQNLQSGSVDLVVASPGFMAQAVKEVDFFALPYLFESRDHWKKAVDGEVGHTVTKMVEQKTDFKILGYWSAGVRNYYGFQPIEEPEDLKGIKIRSQDSPTVRDAWKALGAQPTSVAWNEMYQALQNQVVDAAENDFTNIYQASHHETAKYISLTQHDYTTRLFFTSQQTFDALDEKQQQAFMKAAKAATEAARKADDQLAEESKQKLKKAGVKINKVDTQPFVEKTEPVREKAVQQLGMEALYQKVQELK